MEILKLIGAAVVIIISTWYFIKYKLKDHDKRIEDLEKYKLGHDTTHKEFDDQIETISHENNKYFQEEVKIKRRLEKKLDLIDLNLSLLMRTNKIEPITGLTKGVD